LKVGEHAAVQLAGIREVFEHVAGRVDVNVQLPRQGDRCLAKRGLACEVLDDAAMVAGVGSTTEQGMPPG